MWSQNLVILGIFEGQNLQNILSYFKSAPSNLSKYKDSCKNKNILNLWLKASYSDIFVMKFWKAILKWRLLIFRLKFRSKQNNFKVGTKMPYTGVFDIQFWKTIVKFEINSFKFVKKHCFLQNKKGQGLYQKRIIWVFLGCNFEKLLSYLKSSLSNSSKRKVLCKNINLTFGPEMPYSNIFRLKFEKPFVVFDISTLELVKIQNFVQNKKP